VSTARAILVFRTALLAALVAVAIAARGFAFGVTLIRTTIATVPVIIRAAVAPLVAHPVGAVARSDQDAVEEILAAGLNRRSERES
jgi:hypothetical protein